MKKRTFRFDLFIGILFTLLLVTAGWILGCSQELPESESDGAKLYVRYCSGEGCHGVLPPKRGGRGYWDMQYERMIPIMRKDAFPLPSVEEKSQIIDYLHRHARGSDKKD